MKKVLNQTLNYATEIQVGDKTLKIDFSDKRLTNKVLKLIKKYQNLDTEIKERIAEIEKDESMDELDKLIAYSDVEVDILSEFKSDVDLAFNAPVTTILFGSDVVPEIERYFEFFEAITPIVKEVKEAENEKIVSIQKKYGLDRLESKEADVVPFEKKE